ncbi:MAG: amino acid--[acyl-carrier-protein] ligase [Dokdonella sp.]|uniref:amino acid--[acyl-carrier-protein] ligase n=1 Tax=Dokdonella sp. TaxID=2291710 RepID=UPI0032631942
MTATAYDPIAFHDGLVAHGLIVPAGVQGIFGRGPVFEDILERFDRMVLDIGKSDGAQAMLFPPTIDRSIIEKTNYMESFPHLVGAVYSFFGKETESRKMAEQVKAGESWGDHLSMTHVCLNPAACYPVYPTFTGTVPAEGRLVTLVGWVFRHEPSIEPTRMQAFRIREYVRCGTPEQVVQWRDMWLQRGVQLLESLGLPARTDVASDPFFGKGGKMLATNQVDQQLKFEVLVPVISQEKPTAVCSFNFHQDKFGQAFDIRTPDGAVANTACLGFGLERVVMALLQTHGFDPGTWPESVCRKLWA